MRQSKGQQASTHHLNASPRQSIFVEPMGFQRVHDSDYVLCFLVGDFAFGTDPCRKRHDTDPLSMHGVSSI